MEEAFFYNKHAKYVDYLHLEFILHLTGSKTPPQGAEKSRKLGGG